MISQYPKAILAILVSYGAGIWCAILALRKSRAIEEAKRWPSVRGKILESVIYKDPDRNATHFRVRYEFVVGERIEGNTPRLSGNWFWNNQQQKAFVDRYKSGQEVDVFYNPRDPRKNCLDRKDRSGIGVLWVISVGGVILASLLVWLYTTE